MTAPRVQSTRAPGPGGYRLLPCQRRLREPAPGPTKAQAAAPATAGASRAPRRPAWRAARARRCPGRHAERQERSRGALPLPRRRGFPARPAEGARAPWSRVLLRRAPAPRPPVALVPATGRRCPAWRAGRTIPAPEAATPTRQGPGPPVSRAPQRYAEHASPTACTAWPGTAPERQGVAGPVPTPMEPQPSAR
jgi:hypothetical protein